MQFQPSNRQPIGDPSTGLKHPRVLICIPTLGFGGGAERQIRLLAGPLVSRGVALSIFSRFSVKDEQAMAAAGVRLFPIRRGGNHSPSVALQLLRVTRLANPNVIHTVLPQMDLLGGITALASRRGWLLAERSSPHAYPATWKNGLRAFLGRRADVIVANSQGGLDVWPEHPFRQVVVNGIDATVIDQAPRDFAQGREILRHRTVVVSTARLSAEKRLDELLRAVNEVKDHIPNLLVVLIGTGPEETELRRLAQKLGITSHVCFAGFRADVWSWLKHASAFVSTSLFEGHPNAVMEAAVARVPQVLSDIPPHRAALGDDGAVFVRPEVPGEVARALLGLLRDRDRAHQMASTARDVIEGYSVEKAADRYLRVYRSLLDPV